MSIQIMRWRYHKDILWFLRLMEWQDICKKDTFVLNVEQTFLKKRWKIELQVGLASVNNVMRITFISWSYQTKITSLISMIVWLNPLILLSSPSLLDDAITISYFHYLTLMNGISQKNSFIYSFNCFNEFLALQCE